jgi:hypothetical protein
MPACWIMQRLFVSHEESPNQSHKHGRQKAAPVVPPSAIFCHRLWQALGVKIMNTNKRKEVMKHLLLFLIIICFVMVKPLSYASAAVNDIDGWEKAKWGMSESEVDGLYGKETTVEIENIKFKVSFHFEAGKLSKVFLSPVGSNFNRTSLHKKIRNDFIKKYGNIQDDNDIAADIMLTTTWNMPSTIIDIISMSVNNKLFIMYKENESRGKKQFRNASWRMSPDEVKKTENSEFLFQKDNILAYKGKLIDFDALIAYFFAENQLVRARYVLEEEHTNKNDYIEDYKSLKNKLISKYGEPSTDKTEWKNDLYRGDPSLWGFAVSLGHLYYYSIWYADDTNITLSIRGDNYKIHTILEYESKQLVHMEEREKQNRALDAL